jgi:hypothetical protein
MPRKPNESMKYQDTMRKEYDMSPGIRGKYSERFPRDVVVVTLAPDVAASFPGANAANKALRVLLKAAKKVAPSA